jgi:hypothetical protein
MVFGIALLAFGALLLLNNTDIINLGPIHNFWPLLLIVFGISTMVNAYDRQDSGVGVWKGRRPHSGGGVWLILVGVWLLVSTNHLFGLRFRDTWPMFIIAWGVSMVWRSLYRQSRQRIAEEPHGR